MLHTQICVCLGTARDSRHAQNASRFHVGEIHARTGTGNTLHLTRNQSVRTGARGGFEPGGRADTRVAGVETRQQPGRDHAQGFSAPTRPSPLASPFIARALPPSARRRHAQTIAILRASFGQASFPPYALHKPRLLVLISSAVCPPSPLLPLAGVQGRRVGGTEAPACDVESTGYAGQISGIFKDVADALEALWIKEDRIGPIGRPLSLPFSTFGVQEGWELRPSLRTSSRVEAHAGQS